MGFFYRDNEEKYLKDLGKSPTEVLIKVFIE